MLVVAICATSGCGLPDARPDLPVPRNPQSNDAFDWFRFTVPSSIAAPFLGVEVYYRFAAAESASEGDLESRVDLLARGFLRIASSNDRYPSPDYPLIDRPGAGVQVTLDFSGVDIGTDPVATFLDRGGSERRVLLRRADHDNDGRYKRFACDEFATGDDDVDSVEDQLADSEDCGIVQLQVYALSYDGGTDRFTVYSDAAYLGTIDLTFGRP